MGPSDARTIMFRCLRLTSILAGLLVATGAGAVDVTVSGLFPNKALVQIDGGPLRTLSVGQKTRGGCRPGVRGTRCRNLRDRGQTHDDWNRSCAHGAERSPPLNPRAHRRCPGPFHADGQVNGRPIRFVVDTGSTLISLPASEARRLSIDYLKGQKATMGTANGNIAGYIVKLDTVSIGGVTLYGVDAAVVEGTGLAFPLLGMSFLNRMNMKREGDIMTLTKRY